MKNLRFQVLGLYEGDPLELAEQQPDNVEDVGSKSWTVDKKSEPWLGCHYGPDLKVLVRKKIETHPKQCKSVESKKKSGLFDTLECE